MANDAKHTPGPWRHQPGNLNGLFNAGGTLASIVDSFLNGQGAVTVEEMDAALTAWHALIKSPGKTRREKTDATSIQNRLAFTLAKVSIRLRQPVMEDDRRELRKLIEEAIAMERESRK